MFISLAYPDSISDKEITKQSGYHLDIMETYTELIPQENKHQVRCCPQKRQKQIKLQEHEHLLSMPFNISKFLNLLQMKFQLTCSVIEMTYCKYVQQFQIGKASFMGRKLDWNKTTMTMINYSN